MRILIFAFRVASQGYGVDVVIKQLAEAWEKIGYEVTVGCILSNIHSEKIEMVTEDEKSIFTLIEKVKPNFIYIHTFPFWEFIPVIKSNYNIPLIIHDYGDPTPELIANEQLKKFIEKQYQLRKDNVKYADEVICISEFVRTDIGYEKAEIVLLGSENVIDKGPKLIEPKNKLKVGMLGRIGESENDYKGVKYFIKIAKELGVDNYEFFFCGHGDKENAKDLIKSGIAVKVNLSEEEKTDYLRSLDIFISTSLWEGFNLPLLEAQALGTLSLAFDTGAHPEVTIFNFGSVHEIVSFINHMNQRRDLLLRYSTSCYTFARSNFSWTKAAHQILKINNKKRNLWTESINTIGKQRKLNNLSFKTGIRFIKEKGLGYVLIYSFKKLFKKNS